MSPKTDPSFSQELTIADLFAVFKRRRVFIILSTLLFVMTGVAVCLFMIPKYRATGEIQVAKQSSDELGLDGMKGDDGSVNDALEDNITIGTQADILQSDTLALQVIQNLGLENTPDFQPVFNPVAWALNQISPKGPKDPVNASLEDSPRRRARVLTIFRKHLKVTPLAGTRLVDISYSSSNPQTAATVINQLTKGLVDYTFQTRYNATTEASRWLAGQMDDLKKQAEDLQSRVVQLQREAGVYSLGTVDATGKELAYNATLDRLQQASQALTEATSNRILKQSIYETAKSGDPEAISGLAGASFSSSSQGVNGAFTLLQTLRGQEATIQTQLAADSSKYGSANPKLQDERASLVSATAAVNQEVKRIGARAENDYRAALITEGSLRADYDKQRASADRLNDKAIEYSIVKQQASDSRQLYETLYQHLKEAGVIDGLRSSNVTVVDPGRIPAKPSQPNIPIYLGASLFGGLFFGAVGALFLDSTDDRVQCMARIEQSLGTPLLGVIPTAATFGGRRDSYLSAAKASRQLPKITSILAPQAAPVVTIDAQSNTAFSEALRSLRTTILLSRSASPPKVILVTSAGEGEGKTTISVHLAAALARNSSKVLLVEADLRCPTMSRRLSLSQEKGLSNLLAGDTDRLQIKPFADLRDLAIIPAGPTPPYPAELLGSDRMKELIGEWSQDYDFILIDSPSALAVTDAAVLSRMADITLLITRHSHSTRKSLERAWRMLCADPDTKVGVVLNAVNRDSADYGDYFGYRGNNYYDKGQNSGSRGVRKHHVAGLLWLLLAGAAMRSLAADQNSLLITPGDVLHIQIADTPEMEEHARVTDQGSVPIIGIGEVKVAGLTPGGAADAVHDQLVASHYLNHPQVSVVVEDFATSQVSVMGEVKTSGAYPIATPRPVLDVLALAGGLNPTANRHILIERRGDEQHPIAYYVSNNGDEAIETQVLVGPGDTVYVPRAGIVYVLGDVNRPGGYVMSNNESQLSLLQGLALAGGTTKTSSDSHARLIRKNASGGYTDTALSVSAIEKGKHPDLALFPGDVLYIPFSFVKNLATNGAPNIAGAATQASIYAIP